MANRSIEYRDPQALVQTDWLEAHLSDPNLRIFDCTTHLKPVELGSEVPYLVVSGKADFDTGHIPGAGFLDIQGEFSDNAIKLRFTMPSADHFSAAMSRHGVGEGTRVILYCAGGIMWATRLWWMLRAFGFDNAAVLDGGWDKWRAEDRPVSTEPCAYTAAKFIARPRPGMIVDKQQVLAALGNPGTVIINALSPDLYSGKGPSRYGRPGRVPGSVNVPAGSLLDSETKALVSLTEARAKFDAAGVQESKDVICYCGGGISATIDLFMLYQLRHDRLTLYDGSMGEWAKDSSLPIERD
jgi:thiosulfate/3-mercaptopyruvate sulfurtransferase